MGQYKYYSTQRPVDIGTFPKPVGNRPIGIVNFDARTPVEGGAFLAWGYLLYSEPLSLKDMSDYELRPAQEVIRQRPAPKKSKPPQARGR